MTEPILAVDRVVRTFGGIRAVDDVSFEVEPGAVFGIIGPNGAGKTVLLNLINGVYRVEGGAIRLAGARVDGLRPHQIAALGIGRTFQSTEQFREFRVLEYVLLGRLRRQSHSILTAFGVPRQRRAERAERAAARSTLDRLDLGHVAGERMAELPYGVQKQIDIARVLAAEPRVMLLDEPTSGTTSTERESIATVLDEVGRTDATLIIVDHDVRFITARCERVLVMNYGQRLALGTPDEVLAQPAVIEAYVGA